ncbi:hypothetical protein [Enhygromyxa salina]|nr:hypothetical protein [Enhygromyxa salina]
MTASANARNETLVDPVIAQELAQTTDPDLAAALIVAQLLDHLGNA